MEDQDFLAPLKDLLAAIAAEQDPFQLEQATQIQHLCSTAVQRMVEVDTAIRFKSAPESITYYKSTLPQLLGVCIYVERIVDILLFFPTGIPSRIHEYLVMQLQAIERDRMLHAEMYRYFRLNKTDRDDQLFQIDPQNSPVEHLPSWLSPFFPLPAGTLPFARFYADNKTIDWILHYIEMERDPFGGKTVNNNISWTGSQAGLTELVYALNEMGVLNGSRHEIQKLKIIFEKVFNTSLGNIYKTYEHNRIRKKSRTPFIDNLKAALLRRMDEDDLNAL